MTRFVSRATCAFVLIPILATLVAATSVDFSQGPWGGGVTLDWFAYAWPPLAPVIGRLPLGRGQGLALQRPQPYLFG
ncbi:hypothetical protein ABZ634_19395, partial [Nocardiopsis alba]